MPSGMAYRMNTGVAQCRMPPMTRGRPSGSVFQPPSGTGILRPMSAFYPWFVFAHIVGVVLFAISHGASAYAAFRMRSDRDPHTVASLLAMSQLATGPMYVGLVLLGIGGIGAATIGGLWGEPWVIASVVVLLIVIGVMYSVASPYYVNLRKAVAGAEPGQPPVEPAELERMLQSRRPEVLVTVGTVGLLVLVWLMVLRPG